MKRIALLVCACACMFALGITAAQARPKAAAAKPSGLDKEYLKTSMQGDLFEIRGGNLALGVSHNKAVIRLARRLVTDHTKSLRDSEALARKLGIKIPTAPTASQQWELRIVSTLKKRAFNHWYSSLEVFDHIQDIAEAQDEVTDGGLRSVRSNAKDEIPVLRLHLHLAQQALKANS
jgi:predicted outer membrane protein